MLSETGLGAPSTDVWQICRGLRARQLPGLFPGLCWGLVTRLSSVTQARDHHWSHRQPRLWCSPGRRHEKALWSGRAVQGCRGASQRPVRSQCLSVGRGAELLHLLHRPTLHIQQGGVCLGTSLSSLVRCWALSAVCSCAVRAGWAHCVCSCHPRTLFSSKPDLSLSHCNSPLRLPALAASWAPWSVNLTARGQSRTGSHTPGALPGALPVASCA